MIIDPLTAGVQLFLGWLNAKKVDQWGRLILGCIVSAFISFFVVFGSAGLIHLASGMSPFIALSYAACEACISMAAIILIKVKRDPLAKGLTLTYPNILVAAEQRELEKSIVTETVNGSK